MEPCCCHPPVPTMTADIASSNNVWSAGPWLSAFYIKQGNVNPKGLLFKTGSDRIICAFKVAARVLPGRHDRCIVADNSVLSFIGLQLALFFWNYMRLKTVYFVLCLFQQCDMLGACWSSRVKKVTVAALCRSWAAINCRVLYPATEASDQTLSLWFTSFLVRWGKHRHWTKCSELRPMCRNSRVEFLRLQCLQHATTGNNQHLFQYILVWIHYLYVKWANVWKEWQSATYLHNLVRWLWHCMAEKFRHEVISPSLKYIHAT